VTAESGSPQYGDASQYAGDIPRAGQYGSSSMPNSQYGSSQGMNQYGSMPNMGGYGMTRIFVYYYIFFKRLGSFGGSLNSPQYGSQNNYGNPSSGYGKF
jgi:hypothetical protein